MTSNASPLPEQAPESPAAPLSADAFAAALRGFGPLGILAILLILLTGNVVVGKTLVLPIGAVLVLLWAWRSRTPWCAIGYVRPKSWIGSLVGGIAFGIAFKFLMKIIVMPLLGADPINQPYHFLAGNRAAIPATLVSLIVGAGFGEEVVFRGYAFERLGKLFGPRARAKIAIVLLTSAWFALAHYPVQGLAGVEQAAFTGLAFGTIFAFTGRIGTPMFAHAAFDLTAYAIIYWNLESRVAHLVFR